ncbi:SIMPL domain-containing protein [Chloroflexota bacterium]
MKKIWLVVMGVAMILAVVGVSGCSSEGGVTLSGETSGLKVNLSSQQDGIWVNGSGKVAAAPDVATLRLGIEAQETSVAEAQTKATEAMDKVKKALTDKDVDEEDIQTQYFNIQRITRWDNVKEQETVTGYRVTNVVTAKIREIEKVGGIIDAVVIAGGDLTRIDSIGFSVDDPSEYYMKARAKAVADAEAKAKQLAEVAGVKLGKPTYISESTNVPGPIYRQGMAEVAMAAPAVETSISPGEIEITVNAQMAYAIAD